MVEPDELRTIPLLETLDEDELQQLANLAADVHLLTGEWLLREGDQPAFYLLLEGDIEVSKTVGGVEQVINNYHAGDFFGEVPLLLGSPAVANLRAENPVHVIRLEAADFHSIIIHCDKLAATVLRTMSNRVERLQNFSVNAPVERTYIIGYPADLACYDLRQFLSGNRIDFRLLDPSDPPNHRFIPDGAGAGPFPTVVLADGNILTVPNKRTLAERLGLQTKPSNDIYDAVIIGGGPTGLAAAVYGASEGLCTLLLEQEAPGGQAGTSSRIENYLGFPTGVSGADLASRALQQAKRFGAEVVVTRTAMYMKTINDGGKRFQEITLDGGDIVRGCTVILSTGVSWRSLTIPGADAFIGCGIFYGAAQTEAAGVRGKDVYLIGGGNSAGQAAMFFADYARNVTLLIRAKTIEQGMSTYLIRQLATKSNVTVSLGASVVAVDGKGCLEGIVVEYCGELEPRRVHYETDSLFVFIGADAETKWLDGVIARDNKGYILTGSEVQSSKCWTLDRDPYLLETSVPGVFAAGDVRKGSIKRVASGVGEGSMTIALVHQYLSLGTKFTPLPSGH